jgi:crotonobetainyl-CoA:carnitine CoA-transferase CaiB-like acyl-CoA transferase
VQVNGAAAGLTVYGKYVDEPVLIAYVLYPLGDEPTVLLYTGEEAWRVPIEYIQRGGRAADHDPANNTYRWSRIPALLREILEQATATPQRWESLFERVRAR